MEVYNYNGVQETTITVYIGIQKAKWRTNFGFTRGTPTVEQNSLQIPEMVDFQSVKHQLQ